MGNNVSIHNIEGNEQYAHELIKIIDDHHNIPINEVINKLIEKWDGSENTFNLAKINLNQVRRTQLKTYCFPSGFYIKVEINNFLYKIWKSPNISWSLDYPEKKQQLYDVNYIKLSSNMEQFEVSEIINNVLPLLQDPKLVWEDIVFNIIEYLETRFFGKWNVFILDRERDYVYVQSELSLTFVEPKYNQLIKLCQQPGAFLNCAPEYSAVPNLIDSNFEIEFNTDIIKKIKKIMFLNKAYEKNLCNKLFEYLVNNYDHNGWLVFNTANKLIQNVVNYKYLHLKYPNNLEITIYKIENQVGQIDQLNYTKIISNINDEYELVEFEKPAITPMQNNFNIQLNQKVKDILKDAFMNSNNLKKNIEYISDILQKDIKSFGIFITPNPNAFLKGSISDYSYFKIELSKFTYYLFISLFNTDSSRDFQISNLEDEYMKKNYSEIEKITDDIVKTITIMSPEYHHVTLFPDYQMTVNHIKYNVAPIIIQNKKDNSDIMSVFSIPMSEQEGDEVLVEL